MQNESFVVVIEDLVEVAEEEDCRVAEDVVVSSASIMQASISHEPG